MRLNASPEASADMLGVLHQACSAISAGRSEPVALFGRWTCMKRHCGSQLHGRVLMPLPLNQPLLLVTKMRIVNVVAVCLPDLLACQCGVYCCQEAFAHLMSAAFM